MRKDTPNNSLVEPAFDPLCLHPSLDGMFNFIFTPGTDEGDDASVHDTLLRTSSRPDLRLPIDVYMVGTSEWVPGTCVEHKQSRVTGLALITHGRARYIVNGARCDVRPDHIIVYHHDEHHLLKALPPEPFRRKIVTFWHDGIAELFKRTGLDAVAQIALPHEKAACIERIIDHVADLARRKPAAFRLQMSRCMYDVLLLLLTEVHDYASEAEMPATLVRAMQFALDNIGRVTHTRELARTAGCSNAHFSRLFLRYVGIAPHRWLELNKMRAAAEMLCLSRKKVQLIAEAVGYLDPFHFSRVFKRSTGASPLEYRARFRRQHARA